MIYIIWPGWTFREMRKSAEDDLLYVTFNVLSGVCVCIVHNILEMGDGDGDGTYYEAE